MDNVSSFCVPVNTAVEMSEHFWYVDSSKAERELGFQARDPQLTLADTVRYLRQGVDRDL